MAFRLAWHDSALVSVCAFAFPRWLFACLYHRCPGPLGGPGGAKERGCGGNLWGTLGLWGRVPRWFAPRRPAGSPEPFPTTVSGSPWGGRVVGNGGGRPLQGSSQAGGTTGHATGHTVAACRVSGLCRDCVGAVWLSPSGIASDEFGYDAPPVLTRNRGVPVRPRPAWRLSRCDFAGCRASVLVGGLDGRQESYPIGTFAAGVVSQGCGPLDGQASALVRGGGIVPFFVTPSDPSGATSTGLRAVSGASRCGGSSRRGLPDGRTGCPSARPAAAW